MDNHRSDNYRADNRSMDNSRTDAASYFLDEATGQISYQPLRPSIRRELEAHIQDLADDYESRGLSRSEAEEKAVGDMGDPVTVGTELNEVHRLQHAPALAAVIALLMATGFLSTAYMMWKPEQYVNGFLYYIPGAILLLFTAWKGYPLLIRHWKKLMVLTGLCYLLQISLMAWSWKILHFPAVMLTTHACVMMLVPVTVIFLYRMRDRRSRRIANLAAMAAALCLLLFLCSRFTGPATLAIYLVSIACTASFMIFRGIFTAGECKSSKKWLLCAAVWTISLVLWLPTASPRLLRSFLAPQTAVNDTWDDTYNAVLIRELLSRTPLTGGLELSSEEMMDYGTGSWYFASRDPRKIGLDATGLDTDEKQAEFEKKVSDLWNAGVLPHYIHYDESNVTLWDILPQHYHNNYVIAVAILLFGWVPGLILLAAILLFYVMLFSIIRRIHGALASSLAFGCGQCLLWQTVLYVLGNFGFQYAAFPNLPLVSEGRISIIFNMLLLGLILSAYRYDHVVEESSSHFMAA